MLHMFTCVSTPSENKNKKNITDQKFGKGISVNAAGYAIKTSSGPFSGRFEMSIPLTFAIYPI